MFAEKDIGLTAEEYAEIKANATEPGELGEGELERGLGSLALWLITAGSDQELGWWVYRQWLQ